jgi:hypothetical protein
MHGIGKTKTDRDSTSSVPLFFTILLCWVFEIQLLMQIIVNRIAVISESLQTVSYIRVRLAVPFDIILPLGPY